MFLWSCSAIPLLSRFAFFIVNLRRLKIKVESEEGTEFKVDDEEVERLELEDQS